MEELKEKLGVQIFLNFDYKGISQFLQNIADMFSDVYTLLTLQNKLNKKFNCDGSQSNGKTYYDALRTIEATINDALTKASLGELGKVNEYSDAWILGHTALKELKLIMFSEGLVKVNYDVVRLDEWVDSYIKAKARRSFYGED